MKKLILFSVLLFAISTDAFAQSSFQMPLGTFSGNGKIVGKVHTVKLVNELGNFLLTYGGATKCTTILKETSNPGLFEETDIWDSKTGKVSTKSCQEKGFVFLVKTRTGLTYHWGANKDEAMAKPSPIILKKIKN
ncbi:MAG TPA: hypothetical protein PKY82_18675 [Pyrinomonadaceae bacterium]|nr:hypothetical protein [Pyrinomonadaceae bacterium]